MRRGLLNWSKEELPEAVFDGRVARLQSGSRAVLGLLSHFALDALHMRGSARRSVKGVVLRIVRL